MEFDRELERLIKRKLNDPKELIAEPRRPSLNRSIVTIDGMRNNYYLPKSSYRPKYVGAPIIDRYIGVYQLDSAIRHERFDMEESLYRASENSYVCLFFITNKGWAFSAIRHVWAWYSRTLTRINCVTNKIRNHFHVYLTRKNELVLLFPHQRNVYPFEGNFRSFYTGPGSEYLVIPEYAPGEPYYRQQFLRTRVFKLNKPKLSELPRPFVVRLKEGRSYLIPLSNSPIFSSVFDSIDDFIVENANLKKIPEDEYASILNANHKIRNYLIDIIITFNNLGLDFENEPIGNTNYDEYSPSQPPDLIDLKSHYSWARSLNTNTPLIVNYTATPIDRSVYSYHLRFYRRSIPRFYLYKVEKVQNIDDVFNRHPEWRSPLYDRMYYNKYLDWSFYDWVLV
jgi:hypothetical protein